MLDPSDSLSLDVLKGHLEALLGIPLVRPTELAVASALLETSRCVVLVLDMQGQIIFANRYFEELTGFALDEIERADWFDTFIRPEDHAWLKARFRAATAGDATLGNVNLILTKTAPRAIQWYDRLLVDPSGEAVALLVIGHDVTERQAAIDQLHAVNERLEHLVRERTEALESANRALEATLDTTVVCLAYLDTEFNFVRVNAAYAATVDRDPDYFVGKNHFALFPNEENEAIFRRVRDTGEPFSVKAKPFEYEHEPERGVTHWDWALVPIFDPAGIVTGLVFTLQDVTQRVQMVEEAVARTAEKEMLLREIHHRVKNNLQVISSLLYLQSNRTDSPEVRELFGESRDRLAAMALVHETLYRSEDLSRVDLAGYLTQLIGAIGAAHSTGARGITLEVDVQCPLISIDKAVPCGLIVNEWVTNALKYAFDGQGGTVCVRARPTPAGVQLEVRDDGRGIADHPAGHEGQLGLKLVHALAEQLRGRVEVSRDGGTVFSVQFAL